MTTPFKKSRVSSELTAALDGIAKLDMGAKPRPQLEAVSAQPMHPALLPIVVAMANYHEAVWEAAKASRLTRDEAGSEAGKTLLEVIGAELEKAAMAEAVKDWTYHPGVSEQAAPAEPMTRADRHLLRCAIALVSGPELSEVAGESRGAIAHRLQVMLADSWDTEQSAPEAEPTDAEVLEYCDKHPNATFAQAVRALAPTAPAGAPTKLYVECRECSNCGHIGINDSSDTQAACNTCEWSGDSPKEDVCPGCGEKGTMTAACPECGQHYSHVAEARIATAPAGAPEGWKPMPTKHTDAMVDAFENAMDHSHRATHIKNFAEAYSALLDAAPTGAQAEPTHAAVIRHVAARFHDGTHAQAFLTPEGEHLADGTKLYAAPAEQAAPKAEPSVRDDLLFHGCNDAVADMIAGAAEQAAPKAEPLRHSTKENGDCPHWCKACAATPPTGVEGDDRLLRDILTYLEFIAAQTVYDARDLCERIKARLAAQPVGEGK